MEDLCRNCTLRGDIEGCIGTECFYHHSWFIDQIRDDLINEKMKVIKLLEAVEIMKRHIMGVASIYPHCDISQERCDKVLKILEEVQ